MTVNYRKMLLAGLVLAVAACKPTAQNGTAESTVKNPNAVKVEFFLMSQCPFGVEVVNKFKDVADKLGPDVDFKMEFIGTIGANGELSSMHGPNEVTGDIAQLCAAKVAPARYLNMVLCQNKNAREVATNWESCAKNAQLPVETLRTCINGPEGKQLLKESFERAKAKPARGSPTIFVDGKSYEGRRSPDAFLRAVCAAHKDPKPQACQNIPEPAKVNVVVVGDKRCTECLTDRYVQMLKSRVANPTVKLLDYSEPEGRKFYEELPNAGNIPLVLFDSSLDADKEASDMFGRNLQPVGSYRRLSINSSWNPACANEGGCDLTQCKETLACRKEAPKKLELFVMSQCPYGVRALNVMDEVLKAFENKIDFQVHYIANSDGKGNFTSLHGTPEVEENIRELCAIKHYPKNYQWMDYVLCRNTDIRSGNWEACTNARKDACPDDKDAKPNSLTKQRCEAAKKIDAKLISKCAEGEDGKKIFGEDIKIAESLGVGGSPTWIANGRYRFSGLDAETIKKSFCEKNKNEVKGCEKTLSGPSAGAPVQGGCGNR